MATAGAAKGAKAKEARQQAQAEGLTLRVADNQTGYFCVSINNPGHPKPYQARARRDDKQVHLGAFATAEEAALCIARSPEGRARAAALTSEEARQQAQAEGLTLRVADNTAGYFGVSFDPPNRYNARVRRGGKMVAIGS
eukprot:scaffold24960_cov64-Phaeocystis_antarctica.AAC.1